MVFADGCHDFFINHSVGDILAQAKADAAAGAGFNEAVHGPGIEGIFAVDEGRMQAHIALLGGAQGDQIGQPLPGFQVLGAHDTGSSNRSRQVRIFRILAFGAENAVNPAVFMLGEAHVVHVGFFRAGIGQKNGIIPEAEVIHAVIAFRHGEEGFAVAALQPGHHIIFAVQINGTGIEGGIHAQPFHEMGIGFLIQIIFPEKRNMLPGQYRVHKTVINAIIIVRHNVFPGDEGFLLLQFLFIARVNHGAPPSVFSGHPVWD